MVIFRRQMGYDKFCSASDMFVENRNGNFDNPIRRFVCDFYQRLNVLENSPVAPFTNMV